MTINKAERLRITEIFYSLQGETTLSGLPTVFVRLTGCPLRCTYCDSEYAFNGGNWMDFSSIEAEIAKHQPKYVCVTGGEPLAQPNSFALLTRLCDQGYTVSLETSGAIDVAKVDPRVIKILDIKTPASGEVSKNLWSNLDHIKPKDQIKFVVCDRGDYDWLKEQLDKFALVGKAEILLSPSYEQQSPKELADWIITDHLPVRLQLQLHKYLWGDIPGV